jgi:formylmethanofuran dehydrogenase subunit B
LATWATAGVSVEAVELQGDLFTTLALLQSEVGGREIAATPDPLRRLAQRLLAARYAVLLGAPARLPAQAGLAIEAVHQIVAELNRSSRAAALWLGGGNGAATANQVFSWLSGLPLRSRAGPLGIEHEPLAFASARLLADRAVDAMLWVSAFDGQALPPVANPRAQDLPLIVLGPPALATSCRRPGAVFIAVSTPGIGSDGHVFRTDGTVLMPLTAARRDHLPTVADAAQAILKALRSLSPGSAA